MNDTFNTLNTIHIHCHCHFSTNKRHKAENETAGVHMIQCLLFAHDLKAHHGVNEVHVWLKIVDPNI